MNSLARALRLRGASSTTGNPATEQDTIPSGRRAKIVGTLKQKIGVPSRNKSTVTSEAEKPAHKTSVIRNLLSRSSTNKRDTQLAQLEQKLQHLKQSVTESSSPSTCEVGAGSIAATNSSKPFEAHDRSLFDDGSLQDSAMESEVTQPAAPHSTPAAEITINTEDEAANHQIENALNNPSPAHASKSHDQHNKDLTDKSKDSDTHLAHNQNIDQKLLIHLKQQELDLIAERGIFEKEREAFKADKVAFEREKSAAAAKEEDAEKAMANGEAMMAKSAAKEAAVKKAKKEILKTAAALNKDSLDKQQLDIESERRQLEDERQTIDREKRHLIKIQQSVDRQDAAMKLTEQIKKMHECKGNRDTLEQELASRYADIVILQRKHDELRREGEADKWEERAENRELQKELRREREHHSWMKNEINILKELKTVLCEQKEVAVKELRDCKGRFAFDRQVMTEQLQSERQKCADQQKDIRLLEDLLESAENEKEEAKKKLSELRLEMLRLAKAVETAAAEGQR
ncbi:hypothetical protein K490DRAFT_53137 [Saccharata proteae CBS 121410]|uniref:Uncharacterized protein n=1 Tax=Saccharata proteae CBS 121410 TaxID=1314787 RepID=A0A9P4M079_9PEZI|nr:hypothetical protein K490DRAFT_53137 [Saccharata proteae CBS 121410]